MRYYKPSAPPDICDHVAGLYLREMEVEYTAENYRRCLEDYDSKGKPAKTFGILTKCIMASRNFVEFSKCNAIPKDDEGVVGMGR